MQVDPDSRPSVIGPPFTGHFRVTADTPRGLQPFQPGPDAVKKPGRPFTGTDQALAATPRSKVDRNLQISRNYFDRTSKDVTPNSKEKQSNGEGIQANGDSSAQQDTKAIEDLAKEPKQAAYCFSCGVDCTHSRFHYAKAVPATAGAAAINIKYDMCPSCFQEGRYPSNVEGVQFVKLEDGSYSSLQDRDAPWTDSEVLLLLEGLEMFDDNWNSIADHVRTRSREECVMKFLQLEIEDKYLDEGKDHDTTFRALNYGSIPFNQADNPVLSVVSFLAGLASPEVAAAAAGRSVDEMKKFMRSRLENGTADEDGDKGKKKEVSKAEDAMEVDQDAENQVATVEASDHHTDPTEIVNLALGTSAARAAALASHEEREMTRLVAAAVNTTLQKFDLKLSQFAEMEALLQEERQELERGRERLFLDRLAFKKRVTDVQEQLRKLGIREHDALGGLGEKLSFMSVTGRAEEDVRPLGVGDEGFKNFEM